MEELHELAKQRAESISQVVKGSISSQRFKLIKELQKNRVEKQTFILSMMRANKSMQAISKNIFYKYSLQIMRKINPSFEFQMNMERIEEHFLNDFVGMYRQFFYKYEQTFVFKLKIQNLIRPTNHNLIYDLVRYLIDFCRDYFQQTCFWYMKSTIKIEKIEEQEKQVQEKQEIVQMSSKKLTRASLNQLMFQRENTKKNIIEESQKTIGKKDGQKNYQVLDITALPSISSQHKDGSTNLELLKIRINEFYRDLKFRNQHTKVNLAAYYARYHGENVDPKQKQFVEVEQQAINRATHPFKLSLTIEKSGFNFISIAYSDAKNYCKAKDKKLSPLRISQRFIPIDTKPKMDFITSLKVIRISDNFLPPLAQSQSIPLTPKNSQKISFPFGQSSARGNLVSSSSAANQEELQKKLKKQSYHQIVEAAPGIIDKSMIKDKSYRKLNDLKRNFKSEDRRQGSMPSNNSSKSPNDPEKKIFDWLQKLRQVKQIQRKKIMGLS